MLISGLGEIATLVYQFKHISSLRLWVNIDWNGPESMPSCNNLLLHNLHWFTPLMSFVWNASPQHILCNLFITERLFYYHPLNGFPRAIFLFKPQVNVSSGNYSLVSHACSPYLMPHMPLPCASLGFHLLTKVTDRKDERGSIKVSEAKEHLWESLYCTYSAPSTAVWLKMGA